MKKITLLLFAILPIIFYGQTTIGSYTFDSDKEGWLNAGATEFEQDGANYYNAAGSLRMLGDNNKLISSPKLNITPGTYIFTFRAKGVVGTILRPQIKDNDAGNATNGDSFTIPSTGGDTGGDTEKWFELSQTIEVTVSAEYVFRIQNKSGSTATFYIDDATIVKADVSGNTLAMNVIGSGLNTVDVNPQKVSYDPSDVVTLTASAGIHWNFNNWSGDLTGSTNPAMITMDTDKTVNANFVVDPSFDYAFNFNTDDELEGWTMDPQVSIISHTGGLITLSITAEQWSRFNLFDFPISASTYNKATIIVKNEEASTDQFGVTLGPNNNTITYPLLSQAAFQTIEIDLTQYVDWTGDVDSFRIRFADADNPTNTGRPTVSHNVVIDSVVFSFDASLSASDVSVNEFSLYPNPASNLVYINSINTISKIEMFEITGKRVLENVSLINNTVNVSQLRTGMYLMRLTDVNGASSTKKIMIK